MKASQYFHVVLFVFKYHVLKRVKEKIQLQEKEMENYSINNERILISN